MKWLLILILLCGCTMIFDGKEVGGAAHGPVIMRFNGDQGECQKYIYEARVLLGNLKQQMEGRIKSGQVDRTLEDGTKIHAQSNRYGLADIDEIWIDSSQRKAVSNNDDDDDYAIIIDNINKVTDDDFNIFWGETNIATLIEPFPHNDGPRNGWATLILPSRDFAEPSVTPSNLYHKEEQSSIVKTMYANNLLERRTPLRIVSIKDNGHGNYGVVQVYKVTRTSAKLVVEGEYKGDYLDTLCTLAIP